MLQLVSFVISEMNDSLSRVPGIGDKTIEAFKRLSITSTYELILHFPSNIIQRKVYLPINQLSHGDVAVLKVKIESMDPFKTGFSSKPRPFKIYSQNETGKIQLVFFSYYPQYVLKWAKIGSEIIVIGKVDVFNFTKQIAHPEIYDPKKNIRNIEQVEVVYPLTYGVVSKQIHKYTNFIIDLMNEEEEWIDEEVILKYNWPTYKQAIKKIHNPLDISDVNATSKARSRVAYDELLAMQLAVNLLREYKNSHQGRSIKFSGKMTQDFIAKLPFEPTSGQLLAIRDIESDQVSNKKMSRLLQGDVGSGKTIVAIAAMLNAIEAGHQAVLMAPTDVLANQHFVTLGKLIGNLSVKFELLTGKTKQKDRKKILGELENGEVQILVGTHAVFQEKVNFYDLALVVIDEQHRFGVEQRLALLNKGNNADLLIMSATPIPRSLSLVLYGDMEVSRITEKPKSRIPIKTSIMPKSKLDSLIFSLENVLKENGKIYWICPLVSSESEEKQALEKVSAEKRLDSLIKRYPGLVGIVHGQLDNKLKQENLDKFTRGEYKILVATTVVEVGVDVPDATVIIIEDADSFGLSQLHQLRGRVGRGNKPSNCILLYKPPISNTAWERLSILKKTEDGFLLAEEDLRLRGGGDIGGIKQSGVPEFKVADFVEHYNLIPIASDQAKRIIQEDCALSNPKNKKYHQLLKIFGFKFTSLDW